MIKHQVDKDTVTRHKATSEKSISHARSLEISRIPGERHDHKRYDDDGKTVGVVRT
jgi:hypothetical protein